MIHCFYCICLYLNDISCSGALASLASWILKSPKVTPFSWFVSGSAGSHFSRGISLCGGLQLLFVLIDRAFGHLYSPVNFLIVSKQFSHFLPYDQSRSLNYNTIYVLRWPTALSIALSIMPIDVRGCARAETAGCVRTKSGCAYIGTPNK